MKQLILMYVYFDKNGDIKAITPSETEMYSKDYRHIMLPLEQVEDFITGKKNTFDYLIKTLKKITGETYKLTKKFANVSITRSLDTYLTKVNTYAPTEPVVKILTHIPHRSVTVSLNKSFKEMYTEGTEEEIEKIEEFINSGMSTVYITEKNNPYNFYARIDFVPRELFEKLTISVAAPEHVDLRNSSAYTKRLVESYQYVIKE
jgi:predicted nucleotide-binding protein (sugar kinase/HSP70/actin superfamily)